MKDKDFIINLIENGYECDYLDFKAKQYSKEKYESLLKDIMAMANSKYEGDKYIVVGIKDKPSGERDIIGVNSEEFIDSSNYQQVVLNNIEPEVSFDYFPFEYKEKLLGIFKIYGNQDRPYMLKKKYNKLNEGLCLIRKGSQQSIAVRKDFDEFYLAKEKFEVKIMDPFFAAVYDKKGCGRLRVTIRNLTNMPITIQYGVLIVSDQLDNELSRHRLYGIDEDIVGADFQLSMSPKTEKLCDLYLGFTSTDCLRLKLDEFGATAERFVFKLILIDTQDNEYITEVDKGIIVAKGDFLWKVKLNNKRA